MQFTLRPYQQESADKSVEFLTDTTTKENGLLMCPTGAGKSIIIAEIVTRLAEPCIVFQPSREILTQNFAKLVAYGYKPAIWSASFGRKRIGDITLATIGSAYRNPAVFGGMKYCIIDECHGFSPKAGMYREFLDHNNHIRVLGLTATPYRLVTDGFGGAKLKFLTRTRPRVFHRLIHYVQNGDLFEQGYLAKLEYKEVKIGFRKDRLRINTTGADYTEASVKNHFRELNFSDQIIRCCQRVAELGRGPVLVFTSFVEEARYVASRIPGAAVVTADTDKKERELILWKFRDGRIPVVANVGVLTVGFDYPELANVILARPTLSMALYYQMVGRCMRPHPSKASANVIDMVGLVDEFGRIEDMVLKCGPHDTWFIESRGQQMTNIYYKDKADKQEVES